MIEPHTAKGTDFGPAPTKSNQEMKMTKPRLFLMGLMIATGGIASKFGLAAVGIFIGLIIAWLAWVGMGEDMQRNKTLSNGDGQG